MSPEQADGRIEEIDERSDVWSLGAVLYELLTGRPPYEGVTPFDTIGKVLKEAAKPVREVCADAPAELASVCAKALTRDKKRRYGSAAELAREVEAFQSGARVGAYAYSSWELVRRFVARNKAAVTVATLAIVVLTGVASASYVRISHELDRSVQAEEAAQSAKALAEQRAHEANCNLAEALAEKASLALADGNIAKAEALAAASLNLDERPDARGVVLVATNRWHPRLIETGAAPAGTNTENLSSSPWGFVVLDGNDVVATSAAAPTVTHRLVGHTAPIELSRFSHGGDRLATADSNHTIHLWNLTSSEAEHVLDGHREEIVNLEWSVNDDRVISTDKTTAVIWDTHTGAELGRVVARTGRRLMGAAVSPQPCIAISLDEIDVRFSDYCRGRDLGEYSPGFWERAFSSDGRLVAGGDTFGVVRILEVATHRLIADIRAHESDIRAVAFSDDGALLATASTDRTVALWEVSTGNMRARLGGIGAVVKDVRFVEGSRRLWAADSEGGWRLWEVSPNQARTTFAQARDLTSLSTAAGKVAAGDEHGVVRVWPLDGGEPAATFELHRDHGIASVQLSPDGATLLAGDWRNHTALWDVATGRIIATLKGGCGAALAADGAHVATGAHTSLGPNVVRLWGWPPVGEPTLLPGYDKTVCGLGFSPDGKLLALGDLDKNVHIWDLASTTLLHTMVMETWGTTWKLAFSPDSKLLVTAGDEFVARVWDVESGKARPKLSGHKNRIRGLAFSPDGRLLATGGLDGSVRLWTMPAGESVAELNLGAHPIPALGFVDARTLAVAGVDGLTLLDLTALDTPGAALVDQVQKGQGLAIQTGKLSKEVIMAAITGKMGDLRDCYAAVLPAKPTLTGTVKMKWFIEPDGSVSKARVTANTLAEPVVERCIVNKVSQWKFPQPRGAGSVEVNYPFQFAPDDARSQ